MLSSTVFAIATAMFLGFGAANPLNVEERSPLQLDSDHGLVAVTVGGVTERDPNPITEILRRDTVDCQGSAFCERLGSSCDNAYNNLVDGNTYTGGNSGSSGACSGTCGVFIETTDCKLTGRQIKDSYQAIRNGGCEHCGRNYRDAERCQVKIDRVSGC